MNLETEYLDKTTSVSSVKSISGQSAAVPPPPKIKSDKTTSVSGIDSVTSNSNKESAGSETSSAPQRPVTPTSVSSSVTSTLEMTQLREDNAHLQGRSAELLTSLRDLEVEVTEGRRDRDEARAELRNKIGPLEQKVKDLNEENTLLRSQLQELQSSKLIQLNQVNGKVNELEKALTKLVKSSMTSIINKLYFHK
jgi:hypothetical protein